MLKKHILTILCAAMAVPAISYAGVSSGKESKAVEKMVEECKESWISGDIGVNVVSQYQSRGLIFENQGAITQPFADLYFKLYEGDGFLNKVSLNVGIWNSFHSEHTDAGLVTGAGRASTGAWYEFDFTAGVAFTFAKYFTFTPSYYTFLSPNDGFETFQGLNLNLAIDDSELLGAFALHPHFTVLFELDNKAGSGPDEGIYYEVGIAPALPAFGPVTVSFPINAGFGSDDFYAEDGLGFISGGVNVAYALGFIPEKWGAWTVSANATYFYLDSNLEDFNTGYGRIRHGSEHEVIYGGGLVVAF